MRESQPEGRRVSPKGIRFIAGWEGFSPRLYNDPAGHCTIGYGHLVHRGRCNGSEPDGFKDGITQAEGLALLGQDAAVASNGVDRSVRVQLAQTEFDALTSFAYNVGVGAFQGSTLLRRLNAGERSAVPSELMRWTNGGLAGLVRRRRAEGRLFRDGLYGAAETSDAPDGHPVPSAEERGPGEVLEGPEEAPDEPVEELPESERQEGSTTGEPEADFVAAQLLEAAMELAIEMGLRISSTTDGKHSSTSYHYAKPYRWVTVGGRRYQVGRAFDAADYRNPDELYRRFFRRVAAMRPPTELFYDPMGYSYKNGKRVNWVPGGHRDHVHVAY